MGIVDEKERRSRRLLIQLQTNTKRWWVVVALMALMDALERLSRSTFYFSKRPIGLH